MNITASEYANEIEKYQLNNIQHCFGNIKHYIEDDKYKIIVDIGCGSGKITSLLSEILNCDKVIGIDNQQEMINIANASNRSDKCEYLFEDIMLEWDNVGPEMKKLEGQVSLVFTNFVFQWIKLRENAIRNIYRLLSSEGKFFARVMVVPDPMIDIRNFGSLKHARKIQSKEEQLNEWIALLNSNRLFVTKSELCTFAFDFHDEVYQNIVIKMAIKLICVHMFSGNETENEQLISKNSDYLTKRHEKFAIREFIDEHTGEKMVNYNGEHYMTVAVKR